MATQQVTQVLRKLNDFECQDFDPPELKKRFVYNFPEKAETYVANFDDKLMYWAQQVTTRTVYIWNLLINMCLAIETGIALPFILFAVGADAMATETLLVMLFTALVSQIPKRFVWRYRPFMRNRAFCLRRDLTSSFPSRAVTCAVVYGFLLCYVIINDVMTQDSLPWWMPPFMFGLIVIAAYSRVQYGCHYPSDCAVGVLQALLVCALATFVHRADWFGCWRCHTAACYAASNDAAITAGNFLRVFNWPLFAAASSVFLGITLVSLAPPLRFWGKCHHVYGQLFPCFAFQATMLCPARNAGFSLPWPGQAPLWVLFAALALLGGSTALGMRTRAHHAPAAYLILYSVLFVSLCALRLSYAQLPLLVD